MEMREAKSEIGVLKLLFRHGAIGISLVLTIGYQFSENIIWTCWCLKKTWPPQWLMVKASASRADDRGLIPCGVIPKTKKWNFCSCPSFALHCGKCSKTGRSGVRCEWVGCTKLCSTIHWVWQHVKLFEWHCLLNNLNVLIDVKPLIKQKQKN